MTKVSTLAPGLLAVSVLPLQPQEKDISVVVQAGDRPVIAIPDLRGSGEAQQHMSVFNTTLSDEISGSGVFKVVSKSVLPKGNPQTPADMKESARGTGLAMS